MNEFMEGKKTWIGLILMVAGMLHLGDVFGSDNIAAIVNGLFEIGGPILAAYGNWKAHQKIARLQQ